MCRFLCRVLLYGLASCMLLGCRNDEPGCVCQVQIAEVSIPAVSSRHVTDALGHSLFGAGDRIGLSMDAGEFTGWAFDGKGWTATKPMWWPDVSENHTFCAYHPLGTATNTGSTVPMPSLAGQGGQLSGICAFDFLVAKTSQSYNGCKGALSLNFAHASAMVMVRIDSENMIGHTLTNVRLGGNDIVSLSEYDFGQEQVVVGTSHGHVLNSELDVAISKDTYLYYIVNAGTTVSEVTISYLDGSQQAHTLTGTLSQLVKAGNKLTINISIRNNTLTFVESTISDWIDGGVENVILNV